MNTLVRISVLALVVIGAVATAQTSTFGMTHTALKVSAGPPPVCPPSDPNGCGIGGDDDL